MCKCLSQVITQLFYKHPFEKRKKTICCGLVQIYPCECPKMLPDSVFWTTCHYFYISFVVSNSSKLKGEHHEAMLSQMQQQKHHSLIHFSVAGLEQQLDPRNYQFELGLQLALQLPLILHGDTDCDSHHPTMRLVVK